MRSAHPKHVAEWPHMHPLARRFYQIASQQQAAITDIAERAGLSHATLVKWRSRHAPTVPALEAALNVLGYRLSIVPAPDRSE